MLENARHYLAYLNGKQAAVTQTTEAERQALIRHASGKSKLVEIGVFEGVNSRSFRSGMHPVGILIAVDPYPRSFFGIRGFGWARRIAHREVGKASAGQVLWIECRGCDAADDVRVKPHLPVDFVFIDGDHSWEGIAGDWAAWKDQIAPGGIVALHDSRNRGNNGSERFTNEVILHDRSYELVEVVDSLTVLKRQITAV
jgi:predicted O-methyltransferase YrrM